MSRFQYKGLRQHPYRRLLLSLLLFAAVFAAFYGGVADLGSSTHRRQRESLENALNRCITYCYAVEGTYPESLSYIKEHYGLTYDESAFYVDYRTQGSNILPDVTILEIHEKEG